MMTLEVSFFKFRRALFSSFVMFLWFGGWARWRIAAVEIRISCLDSLGRCLMAASISTTIFLYGIVEGVGENSGPYTRRERSASCRGFLERFTTQLLVSKGSLESFLKSTSFIRRLSVVDAAADKVDGCIV